MKTALDVINAGYNRIIQNGIEMVIVSGIGNVLNVQETRGSEILSIDVEKVQKFVYFR